MPHYIDGSSPLLEPVSTALQVAVDGLPGTI